MTEEKQDVIYEKEQTDFISLFKGIWDLIRTWGKPSETLIKCLQNLSKNELKLLNKNYKEYERSHNI